MVLAPGAGWFEAGIDAASRALEVAAAAVILAGGARALVHLARRRSLVEARDGFGHALLFALDFTIGADVLRVASAPDVATLAVVAGVAGVRIALTVALAWELERRPGAAR